MPKQSWVYIYIYSSLYISLYVYILGRVARGIQGYLGATMHAKLLAIANRMPTLLTRLLHYNPTLLI